MSDAERRISNEDDEHYDIINYPQNVRSQSERMGATRQEQAAVAKIKRWAKLKKSTASTFAELEDAGLGVHLVMSRERARLGTLLSDLMVRPTRSMCYSAYEDARAAEPEFDNTCLGIVIQWRSSFWVFHDVDLGGTMGDAGFYVTIENKTYFFEKLSSLVTKLGPAEDW